MNLTKEEIKVILEILNKVAIPVEQTLNIVAPIITKLTLQLASQDTDLAPKK